jgi:3-oxoacyl-[acyl-carrier protein] reductase/meso-butanediol dehydrogenase/(S,S)-butanediol dehydrogenase/diacetyl reductase
MSRTAIITGGSKGIGWGLVQTFASNGYKVVSGSRSFLNEVPKEIDANIKQIEIDVKNKEDHIKLVKTAFDWTGKLDCYINNAGYSEWRDLRSIDEPFLTDIFQTNLFAYFWGAQAAITAMTDGGSILNISSLAAKRGTSNNSAYSATKFGVTGLTQSLCKELGPKGLEILAFPCNQFFGQEPGSPEEIKKHIEQNYNAKFPVFEKTEVNGDNTHPLYAYLRFHSALGNK